MAKFRLGDTVCNVKDYYKQGEIKGYVYRLSFEEDRIYISYSNQENFISTYKMYFSLSRIVLLEKASKNKLLI